MGALLASIRQKEPEKVLITGNKVFVPDLASRGMRKRKREAERKRLTDLLESDLSPEEKQKVEVSPCNLENSILGRISKTWGGSRLGK